MTDCLIIGFSEMPWHSYEDLVTSIGTQSATYRDLALAFVRLDGKSCRALDVVNTFNPSHKPLHNADFMWPVVTYLSTFLAKHNLTYDYVNLFHLEKDALQEKLSRGDVLSVAVTTTLYVIPEPIIAIVEFIRQCNPSVKIIVGGPFIANQHTGLNEGEMQALFSLIGADIYVISQEGESTLVKTLSALKSRQSLSGIPNLAYRENRRYVVTRSEAESNSLEENMVDYGLFPRDEIGEFLSIRTGKSCPFACAFCGFPERAGRYTYMSVPNVERELNNIRNTTDVTTITFLDDTFNVPKGRFKDILRMMIKNRFDFKWNCFYRCDHGDLETIELMAAAGCEGVFLGVESGSDFILERMNKGARRKDYFQAIPALVAAGITIYASFIVGFPGETADTVAESVDLIERTKPDFFRLQLWYCDPATPIWKQREKYGVKGRGFGWTHATMDWRIACDLIEKWFVDVKGSVWLPQYGFEHWSLYYLQRKGMSKNQLKMFLKSFNSLVGHRIKGGLHSSTETTLRQQLEVAATEPWKNAQVESVLTSH